MNLSLQMTGETDEATREGARTFLRALTATEPEERCHEPDQVSRDIAGADLVTWTLAVPGALLALIELKHRLESLIVRKEVRDRIEPTFERLKARPSVTLNVSGRSIVLANVTLDELLDALADAETDHPPRNEPA